MRLKDLAPPQRLAAGLGCVVVLAAVAMVILFVAYDASIRRRIAADLARAPFDWSDSLRALGRSPALNGLALPRTMEGDGAAVAHDTTLVWTMESVEGPYRALVGGGPASPADSAAWRRIAADTGLDRFVTAAGMRDWKALDPRGFLVGPPRRFRDAIHALAQDPDPDFAQIAAITAATADTR